jgi:hypothetical protein
MASIAETPTFRVTVLEAWRRAASSSFGTFVAADQYTTANELFSLPFSK